MTSFVAIVSDAHLRGVADSRQAEFIAWLDALDAQELVLLGDIFHHWWGFPGSVWPPYRPVVDALRRCRARGVPITYVPGNHDFHLGPVLVQELGIVVRGPHSRVWGGRRYFMMHGDEADRSLRYQLTRWLLRGPMFAALMKALGEARGYDLLQRLAGSPVAGSDHYGADLLEAQLRMARPMLGSLVDVVVMGHVHTPRRVEIDGGLVFHLGGWIAQQSWLRIDGDRPSLVQGMAGLER